MTLNQGGFRYKDIESFLLSVNMKFLLRIKSHVVSNSTCLPRYWVLKMCKLLLQDENVERGLHPNFFTYSVDILQCNFKLPKKENWKSHPFYWDFLTALEKIQVENESKSVEALMSTSIWYNRELETTFNREMSKMGSNKLGLKWPKLSKAGTLQSLKIHF